MVGFENESRDDSTSSTIALADGCVGDGARGFMEELGASGGASLAEMLCLDDALNRWFCR